MRRGYLFIALAPLLLTACMPLKSKQAPPTVYLLHARAAPLSPHATPVCAITVQEPEVPSGFNTDRMALYLYGGRRMDYFAGAVWPEHLARTLQNVIIQEAQDKPALAAVLPGAALSASYSLSVRFNDFEPVYAAGPTRPPRLKVSMDFSVVSSRDQKIVFEAGLADSAAASANTQTAIVSGLEVLLQKTIERMYVKIAPQLCPSASE